MNLIMCGDEFVRFFWCEKLRTRNLFTEGDISISDEFKCGDVFLKVSSLKEKLPKSPKFSIGNSYFFSQFSPR